MKNIQKTIEDGKELAESDLAGLSGEKLLDAFVLARDFAVMHGAGGESQVIADANVALLRKKLLRLLP